MNLRNSEVPILTYHSIDSSGSVISTAPEIFRKQMEVLRRSSAHVLSLKEVVSSFRENKNLPQNAVAITFDDGFRNVFDIAFPILKDYGFCATIFLVTSYCGKDNRWYGQPGSIPTLELMTWDQIARMSDLVDFGVHTATHPDLTRLPSDQLENEIEGAKADLSKFTGKSELAFAYPYGKQSSASRKMVEKNFYAACSTQLNFASQNSDPYFLPRVDMYYFSTNNAFASVGSRSFRRYVRFRALLREMRQALKPS